MSHCLASLPQSMRRLFFVQLILVLYRIKPLFFFSFFFTLHVLLRDAEKMRNRREETLQPKDEEKGITKITKTHCDLTVPTCRFEQWKSWNVSYWTEITKTVFDWNSKDWLTAPGQNQNRGHLWKVCATCYSLTLCKDARTFDNSRQITRIFRWGGKNNPGTKITAKDYGT